jgi:serine/threonine-protein kinase RsbW
VSDTTISVPARPEYLHVLRSVVASMAVILDFSLEKIEDLRMAVDEACTQLLALPSGQALTVRARAQAGQLHVTASIDAPAVTWPPLGIESTLAWKILSTLADEIDFVRSEENTSVRLVIRSSISPAAT